MRITAATIMLLTATSAAAQEPPRRADVHTLRALLEAQQRAAEREQLETRQAQALHALNFARAHSALEAERRRLEGRLHASTIAVHDDVRQRHLLESALRRQLDQLGPDAEFETFLDAVAESGVPEPWAPQDPADSLYRAAREQLNAGEYSRAARTFNVIRTDSRFRQSRYVPAAHYWQAFALSRTGSLSDLRRAREILTELERRSVPDSSDIPDAGELAATIDARLARVGDERARAELARTVSEMSRQTRQTQEALAARVTSARETEVVSRGQRAAATVAGRQCPEEDIRTVALNALLQMDAEQALPMLREVMARRDACSVHLRRRAMMMLAEHEDPEAQAILIEAALEDPDPEVREQATFWLSHVRGDAAVTALSRILAANPSPAVRERALFALGQHSDPRATEILREFALRDDLPDDLRRQIVFSLVQSSNARDTEFLRQLYERTSDEGIKQQILATLADDRSPEGTEWIMGIATDPGQPVRVRAQALYMLANQTGLDTQRLIRLYDEAGDSEMRRHVLTVLGQRVQNDSVAVGKLVDIARTTEDADLRRMVVFMLQDVRDPRVTELMAEIIRR